MDWSCLGLVCGWLDSERYPLHSAKPLVSVCVFSQERTASGIEGFFFAAVYTAVVLLYIKKNPYIDGCLGVGIEETNQETIVVTGL